MSLANRLVSFVSQHTFEGPDASAAVALRRVSALRTLVKQIRSWLGEAPVELVGNLAARLRASPGELGRYRD